MVPNSCSYNATALDTSKAKGSISPTNTSSIKQLTTHSSSSDPHSPVSNTLRIHPDETPPTQAQIDIVRYSWERISEIKLPTDDPNVSSSHAFGLAFYDALFELDPTLKPLFSNIFQQARALAGMVSYIARAPNIDDTSSCALTIREINARKRKENKALSFSELVTQTALNDPVTQHDETHSDLFLFRLRELGAKHYFYHVQSHHFVLIGPAVLSAIKTRLGKEFLPEVADAWTRAHAFVAYHMKLGLEEQIAWEAGRRKSSSSKLSSTPSKANCLIQ